jgi:hypothetical protein
MKRIAAGIVIAAALIGLGWTVGQAAQVPQADFELQVNTSRSGETTITCVRGCGLQYVRYVPNKTEAQPSFTYTCGTPVGQACGGAVHGFLTR